VLQPGVEEGIDLRTPREDRSAPATSLGHLVAADATYLNPRSSAPPGLSTLLVALTALGGIFDLFRGRYEAAIGRREGVEDEERCKELLYRRSMGAVRRGESSEVGFEATCRLLRY
jgi:hypothetical protein